jgi:hypothetical protein
MSALQHAPLALLPLLLLACNADKGATVRFERTDAPPDLDQIAEVNVSLDRVEAHVAGGDYDDLGDGGSFSDDDDGRGGWRTITPEAGTFDLLALQNDVRVRLGEIDLPDGKITQIRLFIDPDADNTVVLTDGTSCALDLTKVPPTGVKINHPFKALQAEDGELVNVVIDFDVKESLDQTGECAFALKPVIKIKRVERR